MIVRRREQHRPASCQACENMSGPDGNNRRCESEGQRGLCQTQVSALLTHPTAVAYERSRAGITSADFEILYSSTVPRIGPPRYQPISKPSKDSLSSLSTPWYHPRNSPQTHWHLARTGKRTFMKVKLAVHPVMSGG